MWSTMRSDSIFSTPTQVSTVPWVKVEPKGEVSMSHPCLKCTRWIMRLTLVSAMWNGTMIHTPRSHRGVTMPWRDSHLYCLSLESSCASTAWPSPWRRKPRTKPGGGMLPTLSQTLTAKLICLFCVIRAPHTSCWGLPEGKKQEKTYIPSFIDSLKL